MSWLDHKALNEQYQKAVADATAIRDKAKAENRAMTSEESLNFDKAHTDAEEYNKRSAQLRKQEDLESRELRPGREEISFSRTADDVEAYKNAFNRYLRVGKDHLSKEELRSLETRAASQMATGLSGHGAEWVPTTFYSQVTDKLKAYGGVLAAGATVINSDSSELVTFPVSDDTGNKAEMTSEGSGVTNDNTYDPVSSAISVQPYLWNTKAALVSMQLLKSTSFDVENHLSTLLAERLYRGVNEGYTTANSTNFKGVVTASTLGKTAASATAITFPEVLELKHSVNSAYRAGGRCKFMLNDVPGSSTLLALKKVVDSTGKGLWSSGNIALNIPPTIDGDEYITNDHMDGLTASKKAVLYGDFSKYVIINVNNFEVRRLDELYIANLNVGFLGFWSTGGNLIDTTAVKHLITASS